MEKKLVLKKSIVANLNRNEMNGVQGGDTWIFFKYALVSHETYCDFHSNFLEIRRKYLEEYGDEGQSWDYMPN